MIWRNIQKTLSLILAGFICYLGYRLFILGVSGTASLSIDHTSIKLQILNAAPGLFFMVGGVALAIIAVSLKEKQHTIQSRTSNGSDEKIDYKELIREGSKKN